MSFHHITCCYTRRFSHPHFIHTKMKRIFSAGGVYIYIMKMYLLPPPSTKLNSLSLSCFYFPTQLLIHDSSWSLIMLPVVSSHPHIHIHLYTELYSYSSSSTHILCATHVSLSWVSLTFCNKKKKGKKEEKTKRKLFIVIKWMRGEYFFYSFSSSFNFMIYTTSFMKQMNVSISQYHK